MAHQNIQRRPLSWIDILLSGTLALIVIAGLIAAVYVHHSVRTFVSESKLPIFPESVSDSIDLSSLAEESGGTAGEDEAASNEPLPVSVPKEDMPPPPPATERLVLLVMGIDREKGREERYWRSDTMILFELDPKSGKVAMLSVPRDLVVTIPDYGWGEHSNRINTANFFGDLRNYPGGGPALAKQTIRRNFGIEVDRYVLIDFDGFRQFIDQIGGIYVDVPQTLVDDRFPTSDYGIMTVRFEEGRQLMDGDTALMYSRTRRNGSDFARARRQRQVILAVRDRVLSRDIITSLTPTTLARLIQNFEQSVQTDMTLDEILAFAQAARHVEEENITSAAIEPSMVTDYRAILDGQPAQVLLPKWDDILEHVEETFETELLPIEDHLPPPPAPPTATPTRRIVQAPKRTPEPESGTTATVEVRNGSTKEGLEATTANQLRQSGFNVTGTGSADRNDYQRTRILLYNESAAATASRLQQRYNLAPTDIQHIDGDGAADIVIILGNDVATASGGNGGGESEASAP